jgi:uncharacterized protein DUF1236
MRNILTLSASAALLALIPAIASAQSGTTSGAVGGAITGAIVGGPVGAVIGGVIGAVVGTVVAPPATVVTYVATQNVPPVVLQGNVVIGATLPQTTVLYPIPRDIYVPSDNRVYTYAFVNGQRVVVDANTRVIVAIAG